MKFLIYSLIFAFLSNSTKANNEVQIIVRDYCESIQFYCKSNYDISYSTHIQKSLLVDPNVRINNDISDLEKENCQANWYLLDLKEQNIVIDYSNDIQLFECNRDNYNYISCLVHKTVIDSRDGQVNTFKEFIELKKTKNNWKINSISSNLFHNFEKYNCNSLETNADSESKLDNCLSKTRADKEFSKNNFPLALKLYKESLSCAKDKLYVENKITELSNIANSKLLISLADQYFSEKEYNKSLKNYQFIANNLSEFISEKELDSVNKRIISCIKELNYKRFIEEANTLFKRNAYTKALPLYEEALLIRPNDFLLQEKVNKCRKLAGEEESQKIKKDIADATYEIERGNLEEYKILLGYRETGFLEAKHFFYLAQIYDSAPKFLRKEYRLSQSDFCYNTRQFMVEAKNLGAKSSDFIFFWENHLNQKSRTCLN